MANDVNLPPGKPNDTYPLFGVFAVLLGASIATFLGRLLSVGTTDLRGALGLSFDSASWMGTTYNMGLMFVGPFSVYLGGIIGPRRVLLSAASLLTAICLALPFAGHFAIFISLLALAGLTAGTFYPLTLSFVLRTLPKSYLHYGITAYAIDIVVTTHLAHSYWGWVYNVLSWQWMFWTISVLTPVMIVMIRYGMPRQPLPQPKPGEEPPSWAGFLYASLGAALLYGALDQGERLDWWRSGTFVAMAASGTFLIVVAVIRHFIKPNPLIDYPFLRNRNIVLLGVTVTAFRFVLLASVVLIPSYLGTIQNYRPEQTGDVLLWLAIPQFGAGVLAVYLLRKIDARIILATGFSLVALGCLMDSRITTLWSGNSFDVSQLVLAMGEGLAFNGMVGSIVLNILSAGGMDKASAALTFGGFFQTVRLLGGEVGASFVQFFLHHRQVFHYDLLAAGLDGGSQQVSARTHMLVSAIGARSDAGNIAIGRSAGLFAGSVTQQAFTLSIMDNFTFIAYAATACLLVVFCLRPLKIGFKQIIAASAAKNAS